MHILLLIAAWLNSIRTNLGYLSLFLFLFSVCPYAHFFFFFFFFFSPSLVYLSVSSQLVKSSRVESPVPYSHLHGTTRPSSQLASYLAPNGLVLLQWCMYVGYIYLQMRVRGPGT
ncbi:uncharacterized protein F4817DRAFT_202172 [Daldinia loculata]|uniref:uncharacterized protein n=1 Tax=Daldinia loculata TaxID=103429 RepID=UPI0020C4DCED|nr:uncharacterized protein F4817DRAFT_202172 [Daldinia loculata]KAI1644808.1 hypothetical protein F4817DRAFT_202172 [Daldinia loculata]